LREGKTGLLVAIDEVDRITDPALAERFLNEVKAIFGIPGCIYFVSVSEEALSNFERRVMRMRSVFDSAFDQVVRLEPLTLEESVQLLRLRVTGVPDRFLALCHCLAGGMPRDVLRTAREMFDVHRMSNDVGSSLGEIAQRLVRLEVDAVKRGFLSQVTNTPASESSERLADLLGDPDWPRTGVADLREAVERDLSGDHSAPSSTTRALAAALLFYATVLDLFTTQSEIIDAWVKTSNRAKPDYSDPVDPMPSETTPGTDELAETRATMTEIACALAALHRTLPQNPTLAIRQIDELRAALEHNYGSDPNQ
jgi:hypothetical protein